MEDKSIIIIGAGFAGLSAGIYAQMNGYKTEYREAQPAGRIVHRLETGGLHHRRLHPLAGGVEPRERHVPLLAGGRHRAGPRIHQLG